MGGDIFVGVRTRDGVEHLGVTWTNWLPRLFADPDFYAHGARELLAHWASDAGKEEKRKRIGPSEYGAVLCDLKVRRGARAQLWSCNGYSNFGSLNFAVGIHSGCDFEKLGVRLIEEERYDKIMFQMWEERPATHEEIATTLRAAKAHVARFEASRPQAYVASPALVIHTDLVTRERVRDWSATKRERHESMAAWLDQRGWTSPRVKSWR